MEIIPFKIASVHGASAVIAEGDDLYSCSYRDGALHVSNLDTNITDSIPMKKSAPYDFVRIQRVTIGRDVYITTSTHVDSYLHISLYKNNVLVDNSLSFLHIRYYHCFNSGNILGYHVLRGQVFEYNIIDGKIAERMICDDPEMLYGFDHDVKHVVSDDKYVYCVVRGYICRYGRFEHGRRGRVLLSQHGGTDTAAISQCARYITVMTNDRIQIIKTCDVDFEHGVFHETTSSNSGRCVATPAEIVVGNKIYIITYIGRYTFLFVNELYELKKDGEQFRIGGDFISCRSYLNSRRGILWKLNEAQGIVDIYSFTWNNKYLRLQSSKIKNRVKIIIMLLRRVCPDLSRDLVWMIIDVVMRN